MKLRRWIFLKVVLLLSVIFVSGCIQNHNVKQHQPFNKADYINYCNNGKKNFHQKAYTKAIDNYTKAIAMHPEPRLFTNRGAAFYSIGLYDMAIEDYERAITMNPFDAKAYNNRGTVHYQKGDYQKAIADYDRSILLKPNYSIAQANRDLVLKKRGENGMLIKQEKVDTGKILATGMTQKGRDDDAFHSQPKKGGSGNSYDERSVSLPESFLKAPLKYTTITSGYSKKRLHPILKQYRPHPGIDFAAPAGTPVVSVGDGIVEKANYQGDAGNCIQIRHSDAYMTEYMHLRNFAKGIKIGQEVRKGQVIGYVGRSGMATGPHLDFRFWENGKVVNFMDVMKVRLEKKNYFKQGNEWFYKKKYDLAIKQYSHQISYRPDAKTYTNRGTAFYRKGMYDKAIEDYNHAIRLNPEDAKAYNNRGAAYFQKGNYAKASKDYQKAIHADSRHTLAYDNQKSVRSIIFSQAPHPPKRFEYFAKAEADHTKKENHPASTADSENFKIPPPSKKNNISTYIPPSLKYKNRPQFTCPSEGNFYTLHIASYQTRGHAEQDMNEIKRKLDKPVFIKIVDIPDKGRWYRVFVGQYKEKDQAFYSGEKLKSAGIIEYFSIQAS